MTGLAIALPKINPWALRPRLGGPLVARNGCTAESTKPIYDYTALGALSRPAPRHSGPCAPDRPPACSVLQRRA
jgi:hypothetical protein